MMPRQEGADQQTKKDATKNLDGETGAQKARLFILRTSGYTLEFLLDAEGLCHVGARKDHQNNEHEGGPYVRGMQVPNIYP